MDQNPYKEAAMALTDFLTSSLRQLATFMPEKKAKEKLLLLSEQIKRAESARDITDFKAEFRKVLLQADSSTAKEERRPLVEEKKLPIATGSAKERPSPSIPMEKKEPRSSEPVDLGAMEDAELLARFRKLVAKFLNGTKGASLGEEDVRKVDSLIERASRVHRLEEWDVFEREVQEVQYSKAFREDNLTKLYKGIFQTTMEGLLFLVEKNSVIERRIKQVLDPEKIAADPWLLENLGVGIKSFLFSKQQEIFVLGREREKLKSIIISLVRTIQEVAERNHIFMGHVEEYAVALEKADDLKDIEKIKSGIVLDVGNLRKKTEGLEGEINNIKKKLLTARTAIKSMEEDLQKAREESLRDPLTGLYSRTAFEEKLDAALSPGAAGKELIGLVLCDLDRFTAIQMRYGKAVGDEMLKALARNIKDELREGDYPARFGENSFAVISQKKDGAELKGLSEKLREKRRRRQTEAEILAELKGLSEKLREAIQTHEFVLKTQTIHLTASVAAIKPSDGESVESAINRLMELMSSVKNSGGNRSAGPVI